jgi:hypothetical protein
MGVNLRKKLLRFIPNGDASNSPGLRSYPGSTHPSVPDPNVGRVHGGPFRVGG